MLSRPEFYLPPEPTLLTVFKRIDAKDYSGVALPADVKALDTLKAAVAFLNRAEWPTVLQTAGQAFWRYLHHPMLDVEFTEDPTESARRKGWPTGSIHGFKGHPLQPAVLFTSFEPNMMKAASRPLYVHPELATDGIHQPVEVVAAVANTASRILDWEKGNLKREVEVLRRAEMMEAHVLISGIKQDPKLELKKRAEELVSVTYPRGLDSYSQSVDF